MNRVQSQPVVHDDQDSLASIQLDRFTVEDEAALMSGGRVWKLRAAVTGAVVLAAAGLFWMKNVDTREAYVGAAAGVTALHTNQLQAFLQCAAPSAERDQFGTKERLQGALQSASERLGKGYVRTLVRCSPLVEAVSTGLAAVHVPSDVAPQAQALIGAAKDLQQTVEDGATVPSYDTARIQTLVGKVATSVQSYAEREAELLAVLATHTKK